jgi:hypothetical protein
MFGRVILGIMCAISLAAEASAAALIEETLRNGHVVLHLAGRIDSKDAAAFDVAEGKLTAAGKRIDVVSLNSTGGQLGEGALIAGVIKRGGWRRGSRTARCVRPPASWRLRPENHERRIQIPSSASTRQPTLTAARPTSRVRRLAQWLNLRGSSGCPRRFWTRWAERHRMKSSS